MTHPGRPKLVPCPACNSESIYVRYLDRYVHEDGSDNRSCWRAISRGQTTPWPATSTSSHSTAEGETS